MNRKYRETFSDSMKAEYETFMRITPCPACKGQRLKKESLAVTVGGKNIFEATDMSIVKFREFIDALELTPMQQAIGAPILKEIRARISFLINVGLEYLSLSRATGTLSGGEAQRIRLATQIGSGLVGVAYILDEPSIGLHQRDNDKLLDTAETPAGSGKFSCWWLSMTRIRCARQTVSWTSVRARANTAARSWRSAQRKRS